MGGSKTDITVYGKDDSRLTDDHKKWSRHPKKEPRKLTGYTSAIVLLTAVVHVVPSIGI